MINPNHFTTVIILLAKSSLIQNSPTEMVSLLDIYGQNAHYMNLVATVILPLPVKSEFDYLATGAQAEGLKPGMRVLVSFGKKKIYTGLVKTIRPVSDADNPDQIKHIEEVLDDRPLLGSHHLELFEWMATYYTCTVGEVFRAALPQGLKPESATRIRMTEDLQWEDLPLDDKEWVLMEALSIQSVLTFKEAADIWEILNPSPRIKTMEARGLIKTYSEVQQTYKQKTKTYLRLTEAFKSETQLQTAFDMVTRSPSQENLLMEIVSAYFKDQTLPKTETLKRLDLGAHVVKGLQKKGIIELEEVPVDRIEFHGYQPRLAEVTLLPEQERAISEIREAFSSPTPKPVLLEGVTGSGKTHLYIDLIKEVLAEGKQVLYLLPEITLTKQIVERIRTAFGDMAGIYHSRFNDNERVEIWQKVRNREFEVVVGVRSSIFLPFQDLGLIIVDEEHDSSFKQQEPAPRYNARDTAVFYSHLLKIPILLGSATPSMESYFNAKDGKYHLVELHQRAVAKHLPKLEIVDMRVQRRKKTITGVFSNVLEEAIGEALERKEQVILFQNRRGYAPFLICETCGHVPQCINCDISLTYHKAKDHLRCHYCGYTAFQTQACEVCGNFSLNQSGIGTEKIAESAAELFPNHRVERMDLDTTRTKFGYQQIIQEFELGQIDILVGTQMVSKGLDFENVTLVGVINADQILGFPDFRAYEQGYQLLTQVSGRAGRAEKPGKVIIQTHMPDNPILQLLGSPYEDFYRQQLPDREVHAYPPYARLIRIEIRHQDRRFIEAESTRLHGFLAPHFGRNLLGPDYALVARVRNQYRMQYLLKINKRTSVSGLRAVLQKAVRSYYEAAPQKTLRIILNVDPL